MLRLIVKLRQLTDVQSMHKPRKHDFGGSPTGKSRSVTHHDWKTLRRNSANNMLQGPRTTCRDKFAVIRAIMVLRLQRLMTRSLRHSAMKAFPSISHAPAGSILFRLTKCPHLLAFRLLRGSGCCFCCSGSCIWGDATHRGPIPTQPFLRRGGQSHSADAC